MVIKEYLKLLRKYKTGIALSGGGARGIAHMGVLKALNEEGIYPEVIAGVSAGAIAGAFYADGKDPDEVLEIFKKNKIYSFVSLTVPKTGLMRISGMREMLKKNLNARRFEDLKIPLYVAASELETGKLEVFHQGELVERIIASSSIPILFTPAHLDGKTYVDGGVFQNLPVDSIAKKCRKMIGVHVNPPTEESNFNSLFRVAERTFHLSFATDVDRSKEKCDLFIEPQGLKEYGLLAVSKAQEIFDIGYHETKKILQED